ncbi:UPF0182 family protein [Candidatus Poriferisodalis sp.]|uniref:UPF0182 family membrane protein n=1 Tax=Candidatus Poriferisodalis sp. TaxID=3101277 RepID=UPI003B01D37C
MRPPEDMPPPSSGRPGGRPPTGPPSGGPQNAGGARRTPRRPRGLTRFRLIVGIVIAAGIVLLLSFRGLAGFWTDFLWFDSLGYASVWWKVLWAKIGLGLLFTAIFFVLAWVNLFIAERLAARAASAEPLEDVASRWRQLSRRSRALIRLGVALILAFMVGSGVSGQWESWLFFINATDFGLADPQFGRDVGFYVFRLPFINFLVGWAFAAVLVTFIFTAIWHYLNGAIRAQPRTGPRVLPYVKAHLSLLLGLLALIKAVGYYYDQFELTLSTRGFVDGATFTDVNAQLPVLRLLIVISLFSFLLLIVNIWRRGFTYPVIAVALWMVIAGLAGAAYPAIVQRFQVEPAESTREAPYIERNIEMTRIALGLDDVSPREFNYEPELTAADIENNFDTVRNVRLLDPAIMQDTFQQTQGIKSFYDFRDIDVDRYEIDGKVTQIVLAARELRPTELPTDTWETEHVAYTHGYGVAAAPANGVDANGRPAYVLGDIPGVAAPGAEELELEEPGLYVGEDLGGYAIVGARRDEVDFQDDDDRTETTRYDGADGVGIGGLFRRLAFAVRFAEPNLLVSGEIQGESRILFNRDITKRVELLAPFLSYDNDPYPVVIDGKVKWVLDAYTTTTQFPYAQRTSSRAATVDSDLRQPHNYVRNSVKAVVDAHDGTVTFYVVDDDDPIVQSYAKQFPALFASSPPPDELREHFRYPEDLFRVQTEAWGRYRLSDPSEFYDAAGAWAVAQDPGDSIGQTTVDVVRDETTGQVISTAEARIAPQYLLFRLPGDDSPSFVSFRPFVPFSEDDSRKNLEGFMVVHNDPDRYGQIEVFEIRSDQPIDGPALFNSNIQTEEEISERLTLLNQNGSVVRPGNLLLIPVENSLLYVRPLFIAATGATAVPELQLVIAGIGSQVVISETFEGALEKAIGAADIDLGNGTIRPSGAAPDTADTDAGATPSTGAPQDEPDDGPGDEPAPTPETGSASDLLEQAVAAFGRADAALSNKDLAAYQQAVEEAERLIARAARILEQAATG